MALVLTCATSSLSAQSASILDFPKKGRGVNIIGYDAIWRSFDQARFKAGYFKMQKRNWSWAYWQYDSDFILYNIDKEEWVKPIHEALIPGAK